MGDLGQCLIFLLPLLLSSLGTSAHPAKVQGQGDCDGFFVIESEEAGAWNGLVTITADSHIVGWEVDLSFDAPVDAISSPLVEISGSGKSWKLHSKSFDEELDEGQVLELRFEARFSGAKPDVSKIGFNGKDMCGDDNPTPDPDGDCSEIFTVETNEDGSWHGLLTLTAKEDLQSWKVIIGLDSPADSLETPLGEVSGSGTTWTVDNKSFDGSIPAGDVLELRIKATFSGSAPDVTRVIWNGDSLCDGGSPTTPNPEDDCSDAYSIESEDTTSWHGLIPITIKQTIHQWELQLRFDTPLTSLESPLGSITGSGTEWNIASASFDGELVEGDVFDFRCKVSFSSSKPAIVGITFNDDNICQGGSTKTTQPTKPPTDPVTTQVPHPTDHPGKYPYGEVLEKSMLFYEAQRSGPLPSDQRVKWRHDSAMNDKVLGGYYDAGDHVKFGFPMSSMTTVLAWGGISFYEGYEKAGQLEWFDKCLKWSYDYFMAAHLSDTEFVGQVGDGDADHGFWGRPEDMTMNRPAFSITASKPGSDLAGETAAALAAGYLYFTRRGDTAYAADLLKHARTMFDFADQHRDVYTNAIPAAAFYNSWSGYNDELLWSAAWLAKATGESKYLDKAKSFFSQFEDVQGVPSEFSWDNKVAGAQILMYELTGESKYKTAVQAFLNYLWKGDHTPKGLIWISSSQWGALRHASNLAFIALQAAHLEVDYDKCIAFAETQINYILGDTGRSFVCGWGVNPPVKPHHRGSSCPSSGTCDWNNAFNNPGPNYQTLYGALVGGPDHNDNYQDDRGNFERNEVATDYNAGFQSCLAGLTKIYG